MGSQRPTVHGGPVRLRPIRATPCYYPSLFKQPFSSQLGLLPSFVPEQNRWKLVAPRFSQARRPPVIRATVSKQVSNVA